MKITLEVLTNEEINKIHNASIQTLSTLGMRFDSEKILNGLNKLGAKVDGSSKIAVIPEQIVENAIENNKRLLKNGKKLHLLNGVTSSLSKENKIEAKISGACDKYLDWETQSVKEAKSQELLNYIRIGEKIPEVDFVGNAIVMNSDLSGNKIHEKMKRIETAALIAKNTRKIGSVTVWNIDEIDYLVEIGIIARGGKENYYSNPCLISAKETISPLYLDENSGDIMLEFAKRDLPCSILPMPITGVSAPVTKLGNAIIGNAEILGVLTGIQSVYPEAPVGGGTISGIMDMQTSVVSFSSAEAILQDIAVAEVHQRLYGFDYLIGTGYTDAKYPNTQVLSEKTMKFFLTYLSGRYTYPVGLIDSGAIFSAEQALVDIEICRYIHSHFGNFGDFSTIQELVGMIKSVGIRGHFISGDHTLKHFKENWMPQIFDRSSFSTIEENKSKDIYNQAHKRIQEILASTDFYELDMDSAREIDKVVSTAKKSLL